MANTPNLGLPILSASQASKHVTMNQSLRKLDALVTPFVKIKDRDLATPPGSPADGDRYIVATSPTGAWSGNAGKIAYYDTNGWVFYTPLEGWLFYIDDEDTFLEYTGSTYVGHPQVQQNLSKVGVNTTADATNKLAVASSAILFTNVGNGIQVKVNKNASGDTGSFLFQTGFSGRAEIGCIGDDNFQFKVSPDGSTFYSALNLNTSHGRISFPSVVGSLAAAGTTQGTATALQKHMNVVTTATGGSADGVITPTLNPGEEMWVVNASAATVKVYPVSGAAFNALAANTSISLTTGQRMLIKAQTTTLAFTLIN